MSDKRTQTLHFGGPLGLAGLAMLASATGIVVYSGTSDAPETVDPVSRADIVESGQRGGSASNLPEAAQTDRPDHPPDTIKTADVKRPETAPQPGIVVPPKKPDDKQPAQAKPAAKSGTQMTFIVRIKGAPKIDEAARLYRRDYDGAQAAYADYVASHPALKAFRLVGASYSGELKLAYDLDPGVEPTRAVVRKVQDQLMAVDGVAYADPDYIAHPGKGD